MGEKAIELKELEVFMEKATIKQLEDMILRLCSKEHNTIRYKMINKLLEMERSGQC